MAAVDKLHQGAGDGSGGLVPAGSGAGSGSAAAVAAAVRFAVALGSNLGDRSEMLHRGVGLVAGLPLTQVLAVSRWQETEPVGGVAQGRYLNGALIGLTLLTARGLLASLLNIEAGMGRRRGAGEVRWGPRVIDLDLLLYGQTMVEEEGLTLPHPRMLGRGFVLGPLAEIAPDWLVPGPGKACTVADALQGLQGRAFSGGAT